MSDKLFGTQGALEALGFEVIGEDAGSAVSLEGGPPTNRYMFWSMLKEAGIAGWVDKKSTDNNTQILVPMEHARRAARLIYAAACAGDNGGQ